MPRPLPNSPCPCCSGGKFKKCCRPFLQGRPVENAERLLRVRYAALVAFDARFSWESLHPQNPRRLRDTWRKFEGEFASLLGLDYRGLTILDGRSLGLDEEVFVQWIKVVEGDTDLSYIEESCFKKYEGVWRYYDGLRRSLGRLGCVPESVRVGELTTLFPADSPNRH